MRILHVCFSDTEGGAAIAARRLMQAQQAAGIAADMLVIRKRSIDPSVRATLGGLGKARVRAARFISRRLAHAVARTEYDTMRTIGLFPSGLGRKIRRECADIVHLHWLGNEMMSLREIAAIPQPVVWTCHDMWPFCGAQHYPSESDFAQGYATRPVLDIDRWTFQRKRAAWSGWHPSLICPSAWMAKNVARSVLMRDAKCVVIPNTLDMELFKPVTRSEARASLGLPTHGKLILFGADGGSADPRKGFDLLEDALEQLPRDIGLAVFGSAVEGQIAGRQPYMLGVIDDEAQLATLYAAADVFVAPSRIDNLPNTLLEAQSCGTPCVAFDIGGMREIISTSINGALAAPFDTTALAAGISDVLAGRIASSRDMIRKDAEVRYGSTRVAAMHLDVYEDVLQKHCPRAAHH
jgi:glycosyltransferase involved in cell wall biosynthesis